MMQAERFKLKSAVYLIIRDNDKVLLSLRQNTGWKDGNYSLVAGHVDGGESALEAMCREAKEEAGITIQPDDLVFTHVMHRLNADPDDEYVDFFFECKKWSGELTNAEPEKCAGLDWFSISQLPGNTLDYIKYVIEKSDREKFSVWRNAA